MNSLDMPGHYRRYDTSNLLQSIESLGLQCRQAWDDVRGMRIPRGHRAVRNICISGMGGSALGGHVIDAFCSLHGTRLRVPLKVANSYVLPHFVGTDTLCLISSYSGSTEETVAAFQEARRRRAKIIVICAGGALAALARRYRIPAYVFDPRFNPCKQPRMGLGYSIVGQLGILKRCGLLALQDREVDAAIRTIVGLHRRYGMRVPATRNEAKKIAARLHGQIPVIVAADHLSGNAHVMANQINENSKTFSAYFLISELNHHLMEGLRFPASNRKNLHFFLIESGRYLKKNSQRIAITKQVLRKNNISFSTFRAGGTQQFQQVVEVLTFGAYLNYYMALLNRLDPTPVPYVDFFKKQLAK